MLPPGVAAPDFLLKTLDGKAASLFEPGAVVLAFLKVSCPVCQFTFPFLDRLNRNRAQGAPGIVAISQDDAGDTRAFHAEFGVALPTLLDREEDEYPASNAYGISHVPSLFLVEADGRISWN